jgi:ABC-type Fe3+/spermidine/putrescine transport system ATPase subunit
MVTQDQDKAQTRSDLIAVMNNGQIEHQGAPSDIGDHPATRFVAQLIGGSSRVEGEVGLCLRPDVMRSAG